MPRLARFSRASSTLALILLALPPAVVAQASPPGPVPAADQAAQKVSEDGQTAQPQPKQEPSQSSGSQAEQHLERVEVQGVASDESKRQASTASKIVIGRDEIERYGDSSLGEVLKRLPGVTTGGRPGRGGAIQMRGMGAGYTQILVNGERMPPGFALDEISPSQIERIEVLRAPTAEFGARAIAGTINVVLREAPRRRINSLRLGLTAERYKANPQLTWTRNDKLGEEGGAYNLTVNARTMKRQDDVRITTQTLDIPSQAVGERLTRGSAESSLESVNVTGKLDLRLNPANTLSIQPFVVLSRSRVGSEFSLTETPPPPSGAPRLFSYDDAENHTRNRAAMARINLQLQSRLSEASKLDMRGALGRMDAHGNSLRDEFLLGRNYRTQEDVTDSRDDSWSLNAKLSSQFAGEHSLVAGVEGEGTTREQVRYCLQTYASTGVPASCDFLAEVGDNIDASTLRMAAYAQDEWSVGDKWGFYAGLRWEAIRTETRDAQGVLANHSSVTTPLLHGLYKIDGKGREQVRASLTRSYRPPNVSDLGGRLTVSSLYPCGDPSKPCGANEIDSPDFNGNPDLKPEIATGVEVGYEKYLSKGGLLSANLFYRRIRGLMRHQAVLETVPYAPVPRWVVRPRNIGDAVATGIELEAKFRLDEYLTDALPINIRSNLSLFNSSIDGIPGPNNRLDQQPRYTANLGADYKLHSVPLSLGGSVNYTPSTNVQQSAQTRALVDLKRVIDVFAAWTVSATTNLRFSAGNLLPLDYSTGSQSTTETKAITTRSGSRSFTILQVNLEMKL